MFAGIVVGLVALAALIGYFTWQYKRFDPEVRAEAAKAWEEQQKWEAQNGTD